LNKLLNENLKIVIKLGEFCLTTNKEDTKFIIVSRYEIIYKITVNEIVVLDIWDTRQNPENYPMK
jgi:toxin YoeB